MCLAIPMRVIELPGPQVAIVELDGVRKQVSTALIDEVAVGDYLIVHVGFALNKLDAEEAEKTLTLFAELAASGETQRPSVEI